MHSKAQAEATVPAKSKNKPKAPENKYTHDLCQKLLADNDRLGKIETELRAQVKILSDMQNIPVDMRCQYDTCRPLTEQVIDFQKWLTRLSESTDDNRWRQTAYRGTRVSGDSDAMSSCYSLVLSILRDAGVKLDR